MEFEFWPAVLAGAVGAIVMSAMILMMRKAGKTQMDMALLQGTMFTANTGTARAIGTVTHVLMMSGVVFGSLYAVLFAWFGTVPDNAWWVGALIGIVHGIVAGAAMAMVPAIHPRVPKDAPAEDMTGLTAGSGASLRVKAPGAFAKNYGSMTPAGMVMAHIVFGLVVGLVYAWVAPGL